VLALETEEKQKPDFSFALQHKNRYHCSHPKPTITISTTAGACHGASPQQSSQHCSIYLFIYLNNFKLTT
jgi:hypothetical protein